MKKGIWIIVTALLSLGAIIGANALVSTTNVNTMKKIIDRRTNQDCTESGRRLGNGRFEKSTVPTKCSGCNRRTCQTICGTTPHRQGQPPGDYR